MIFEIKLWINSFLKAIPGKIGCYLRNVFLPYKQGKNVTIWANTHIDTPSKLIIGNNVSINRNCTINAGGTVTIGDDVLIGPNVTIYSQNHNFDKKDILIRLQGYTTNKVVIHNNIWIASNVTILPGVTIHSNSVIGANTLVNKDIPKDSLAVGNPVKIMRKLNNDI